MERPKRPGTVLLDGDDANVLQRSH
jgi:hypothetical protein